MKTVERRKAIIRLVSEKGEVRVEELSEQFQVSSVTIRNDLNYLDNRGKVLRSHGGAMVAGESAPETPFLDKGALHRELKQAIGAAAAKLVSEGESIILDSGSTTGQVAKNLTEYTN